MAHGVAFEDKKCTGTTILQHKNKKLHYIYMVQSNNPGNHIDAAAAAAESRVVLWLCVVVCGSII
jgi:hypothetical protein